MDAPVPPPPPAPSNTTPYGASPGYGTAPVYGAAPGYSATQPYTAAPAYGSYRPTNALAWVSLGLAVGAMLLGTLASIAAVICGHIARRQIRETGQQGDGLAVAGLVVGYLGIAVSVLLVVFFVVLFAGFGISTVPDSI